jgi:hypothetical protein
LYTLITTSIGISLVEQSVVRRFVVAKARVLARFRLFVLSVKLY